MASFSNVVDTSLTSDVRQRVKIACFTLDTSTADGQTSFLLNRGWARARMWSQYGAVHSGACLVFDKRQLDIEFTEFLGRSGQFGKHEQVHYSNETFGIGTLVLSADDLENRGEAVVVQELIEAKCEEVFFKKNLDWQSEVEYRYLVTSGDAFEVLPITGSLAGIIVGQEFPLSELRVLANRLDRLGRPDTPVASLNWIDGRPDIRVGPAGIQLEPLNLQTL